MIRQTDRQDKSVLFCYAEYDQQARPARIFSGGTRFCAFLRLGVMGDATNGSIPAPMNTDVDPGIDSPAPTGASG